MSVALAGLAAILLAFTADQPVARAMAGINPAILPVARFVTWFGQGGVILYPAGILILALFGARRALPERRVALDDLLRATACVFIVVAVAGLSDDLLKIVFGRARPYVWLQGDGSGFHFWRYGARFASFPSGHTTTSVAAALIFGTLFPTWRPVFWLFAAAIAASRIVLDVHYLSDVLAGATLGWLVATSLIGRLKERGWLPPR
jgi:undecaprenyl-diphosphatase